MEEILCTIKLYSGSYIPREYLECNGQELSIVAYQAVYALIGNTYGGTFESAKFNLPKLTPPDEHMKYIICVEGIFPQRP